MQKFGLLMGQSNVSESVRKHLFKWAVDYRILQDVIKSGHKHDMFMELGEAIIHSRMIKEELKAIQGVPPSSMPPTQQST